MRGALHSGAKLLIHEVSPGVIPTTTTPHRPPPGALPTGSEKERRATPPCVSGSDCRRAQKRRRFEAVTQKQSAPRSGTWSWRPPRPTLQRFQSRRAVPVAPAGDEKPSSERSPGLAVRKRWPSGHSRSGAESCWTVPRREFASSVRAQHSLCSPSPCLCVAASLPHLSHSVPMPLPCLCF
ncbi:unnamed protein product [Lampetra fluviatilis]